MGGPDNDHSVLKKLKGDKDWFLEDFYFNKEKGESTRPVTNLQNFIECLIDVKNRA